MTVGMILCDGIEWELPAFSCLYISFHFFVLLFLHMNGSAMFLFVCFNYGCVFGIQSESDLNNSTNASLTDDSLLLFLFQTNQPRRGKTTSFFENVLVVFDDDSFADLLPSSAGGHRSTSASPSQSAQGSPQRARSASTSPSQAFQPGPIPASSGPGASKQSPQLK